MKKLLTLFAVSLLLLSSCSPSTDDLTESQSQGQTQGASQMRTVTLSLTRSSDDATAPQADISEVSIYVYQVERKVDSLVYAKTLQLGDGNLNVELPLGENLQTFVVANATSVSDADSLATVTVNLDADCSNEVYISDIVSFKSDYTTQNVAVTLHRLVGQVVLQPLEDEATLSSFGKFDRVDVTFTNMATGYKVQSGEVITRDVTLSTDLSKGFKAQAYSFSTATAGTSTGLTYKMYQGGTFVNQTVALVDAGIVFEPSMRYTVNIPLTNEEYLESAWSTSAKASAHSKASAVSKPVSVTVTQF